MHLWSVLGSFTKEQWSRNAKHTIFLSGSFMLDGHHCIFVRLVSALSGSEEQEGVPRGKTGFEDGVDTQPRLININCDNASYY
jgi:hypothetical protein